MDRFFASESELTGNLIEAQPVHSSMIVLCDDRPLGVGAFMATVESESTQRALDMIQSAIGRKEAAYPGRQPFTGRGLVHFSAEKHRHADTRSPKTWT